MESAPKKKTPILIKIAKWFFKPKKVKAKDDQIGNIEETPG
jgi:hypothetical protein